MIAVTYYTDPYREHVDPWRESVEQIGGLWPFAVRLRTRGSWRRNCGMKARFIRACLHRFQEPVLWLDVDARCRAAWDFPTDGCDFAAYFIPANLLNRGDRPFGRDGLDGIASGTMFFAHTTIARAFLDAWVDADRQDDKHVYEQIVLGEVWWSGVVPSLVTRRMPQNLCKVFDSPWHAGEKGPVAVEHLQASRKLRRVSG